PLHRRWRFSWNGVVAFETTKMVQAHDIHEFQDGPQPCNPPRIAGISHDVPAVHRVPPALPCSAKIVWWDTSHLSRLASVIQGEQGRMPPDISAVVCHIDREVTNQTNTTGMAVLLQRLPLPEKLPLQKLVGRHGHWIRIGAGRPLRPGEACMGLFERHKPGKSLEPGVLFGKKRLGGEAAGPGERLPTRGRGPPKRAIFPGGARFVTHTGV